MKHLPAGLVHGFLTMETKSKEGHVGCECHIAKSAHTVLPLKQAFPVGLECRSAWWVMPIQMGIKNIDRLLIDVGFKFAGEECGPCQLLLGGREDNRAELTTF